MIIAEELLALVLVLAIVGAALLLLYGCVKSWRVLAATLAVGSLIAALVLTSPARAEFFGLGNIDLDSRQVVVNPDGSISTELSFSVEVDGEEVLLPTVINGQIVSEEEAIMHFFATGEHLGVFQSVEEAERYACWLHLRQQAFYSRNASQY